MHNTQRLFDERPEESDFTASIVFIGDDYIILDRTLFYPLSGNQQCDSGEINGKSVNNVTVESEEHEKLSMHAPIRHYLDIQGLTVGQDVHGNIDFLKRRKIMKLHAASHLVEHFISQSPEFISVEGSFVSHEKDRTDYKLSANLSAEGLISLESQVNDFINTNQPITFKTHNGLRLWVCADIIMPCCGTHVGNTQDIGVIKLSRKNKGKGINRIEITLVNE